MMTVVFIFLGVQTTRKLQFGCVSYHSDFIEYYGIIHNSKIANVLNAP